MIDNTDKNKLYIITLSIDVFIIYTLLKYNLSLNDIIWCMTVLISHILFIYALKTNYTSLVQFLHALIFILPAFTLFTQNILTKIVTCALLFVIQILWIKEQRCILNEEGYVFGYGNIINYYTLVLTIIISIQIGYKLK